MRVWVQVLGIVLGMIASIGLAVTYQMLNVLTLEVGASGYVLKNAVDTELVLSIQAVLQGEKVEVMSVSVPQPQPAAGD